MTRLCRGFCCDVNYEHTYGTRSLSETFQFIVHFASNDLVMEIVWNVFFPIFIKLHIDVVQLKPFLKHGCFLAKDFHTWLFSNTF
jgi:hypothetical protein